MKKEICFILILIILFSPFAYASQSDTSEFNFFQKIWYKITGKAIAETEHNIGPSSSEIGCMSNCMSTNCNGQIDDACKTNYKNQCMNQCSIVQPESTSETSCMEECVVKGCEEYDFSCQGKNQNSCEKECNMKGDAPDESTMSAEQKCITNCVNSIDSNIRCGNSKEGETGGAVCQKCANECVHLYEGPCLNDEKLKAKQKECETCEHCYGEPVMGDSGEGWECIVNVECKDATSEWGDNPGTGPSVAEKVGEAISNVFDGVIGFFKGIFTSEEEPEKEIAPESFPESQSETIPESTPQ